MAVRKSVGSQCSWEERGGPGKEHGCFLLLHPLLRPRLPDSKSLSQLLHPALARPLFLHWPKVWSLSLARHPPGLPYSFLKAQFHISKFNFLFSTAPPWFNCSQMPWQRGPCWPLPQTQLSTNIGAELFVYFTRLSNCVFRLLFSFGTETGPKGRAGCILLTEPHSC